MMVEYDLHDIDKIGNYYFLKKKLEDDRMSFKSKIILANNIDLEELRFFYDAIIIGDVKLDKLNADADVTIIGELECNDIVIGGNLLVRNNVSVNNLRAQNVRVDGGMCTISNAIIESSIYSSENILIEGIVDCPLIYCEKAVIISGRSNINRVVYGEFCECSDDITELLKIGSEFSHNEADGDTTENCDIVIRNLIKEDVWEDTLDFLANLRCLNFNNVENYEQYSRMMKYSEMSHIDNLNEYTDILYIYHNENFLLKKSSVVEDVFNAFISNNMEFKSMSFDIGSHLEFAECLNKICKLEKNLEEETYIFLLNDLYLNIGIKYKLVKRKLGA